MKFFLKNDYQRKVLHILFQKLFSTKISNLTFCLITLVKEQNSRLRTLTKNVFSRVLHTAYQFLGVVEHRVEVLTLEGSENQAYSKSFLHFMIAFRHRKNN